MSQTISRWAVATAFLSILLAPLSVRADEGTEEPSLYDRLGGSYPIAAVVDDLVERLVANEELNENPAIAAAWDEARLPGLEYHLTELICQATGGPCVYSGRSMAGSHVDLEISWRDWKLFETDCRATFDAFGIPQAEQQELFALIRTTKGEIITAE